MKPNPYEQKARELEQICASRHFFRKEKIERIAKAIQEAVSAEREAIAKMVDDYGDSMLPIIKTSSKKDTPYHLRSQGTAKGVAIGASRIAQAIRARGSKKEVG